MLSNPIQLPADAMKSHKEAVEIGFSNRVDYGQIVKNLDVSRHVVLYHAGGPNFKRFPLCRSKLP